MTPPRPSPGGKRDWPALDALRAAAALLVLISHIRAFTLRDAAGQPALSMPGRALFAATGLGHEAVIVFFVLSGFLVTRSMQRLAASGAWSLLRFGAERLSRLWIVLVPCLLLGGLLDGIGLQVAAEVGGAGRYGDLAITLPQGAPARDAVTLLGNLAFVQTIAVPVYGSNGPLWSLAAEAWFYVMAGLGFAAWQAGRNWRSVPPLVALAVTAAWLTPAVLDLFPIWLFGAACAVHPHAGTTRKRAGFAAAMSLVVLLAVLVASRLHRGPASLAADWMLGLATAWMVISALRLPWRHGWWSRPVRGLSAISYSLYLSHVPLLALMSVLVVGPRRMTLDAASVAVMLGELAATLGCAVGLWWAFERHTTALRGAVLRGIDRVSRPGVALAARSLAP